METWKDIEGFDGYQISNLGQVRSFSRVSKNIKYLRSFDQKGYKRYELRKEGKKYKFLAHRLVAQAFIDNPLGLPQVHHKNSLRSDNEVENLEWTDNKGNSLKKRDSGLPSSYNKKKLKSYIDILLTREKIATLEDLMVFLDN